MTCNISFTPEVWGTVSDWVMIVVTAITAYYLYKSLLAQQEAIKIQDKTLSEQQKITQIEQFIFKEKVKPTFELKVGHHEKRIDEVNERAIYTFSFNFYVHNSVAYDLHITEALFNHNNPEDNSQGSSSSRGELHPGMNFSSMPIEYYQDKIKNQERIGVEYAFRFLFSITYRDMLGNYYQQDVIFYEDSAKRYNLHQGGPKPIDKKAHEDKKNS